MQKATGKTVFGGGQKKSSNKKALKNKGVMRVTGKISEAGIAVAKGAPNSVRMNFRTWPMDVKNGEKGCAGQAHVVNKQTTNYEEN